MTTTTSSDPGRARPGATPTPSASPAFPVVGIGASAGGIQALLRLFEQMPADTGMAFVIVLHLSPKYESRADEVLQRVTSMHVAQVLEPTHIEKNSVYLISPSNDLSMFDGYLRVTPAERSSGRPVAIDRFFRSLADAHGTRAISVILSGTGSDGRPGSVGSRNVAASRWLRVPTTPNTVRCRKTQSRQGSLICRCRLSIFRKN